MSEDNDTDLDVEDPTSQIIDKIEYYFLLTQFLGIIIELIFFFVMIKNWCQRVTLLKSAFFYLLTLKIFNNFVYILYVLQNIYWIKAVIDINFDIGMSFDTFSLEVDSLCHVVIATNRFTALIIPLKHERVWSSTVTFSILVVIPLLSIALAFGEANIDGKGIIAINLLYDSHKLVLTFCALILVLVPILKSFYQSKFTSSISIFSSGFLSTTSLRKQKAEKQLLYETIFVCFWKAVNIVSDTVHEEVKLPYFNVHLLNLIVDFSAFISNVGGLIVLLFISSVAREGFKRAFRFKKDGNSIPVITSLAQAKNLAFIK
ncbi:hypothetical protein FO519_008719 [Halicephalobus sp. NKZ332]|nr:hypothetical protein FO519_008719 [Halicephalobus sp. NKZ332]